MVLPPASNQGVLLAAGDGGVFAFGTAQFYGSMGGKPLNKPVVGLAVVPGGGGYWEVASDGGVFSFGDAPFYGSMGGKPLNKPIVGAAPTLDGQGYWQVASDGGVFAFGDATFYGSMGGKPLNQPIVSIAPTADGKGYWLVAADGGIFAFGDAVFYGSMGGKPLNQPIVGMAPTPSGTGYWLVAADGGLFSFGNAGYLGSVPGQGITGQPPDRRPQPDPRRRRLLDRRGRRVGLRLRRRRLLGLDRPSPAGRADRRRLVRLIQDPPSRPVARTSGQRSASRHHQPLPSAGVELRFSEHAAERMRERAIDAAEVVEVVSDPEDRHLSADEPTRTVVIGRTPAGRQLFLVVIGRDPVLVVTAAERRQPPRR